MNTKEEGIQDLVHKSEVKNGQGQGPPAAAALQTSSKTDDDE